ncbi:hypothetical protein [Actimicrobium sp. CCI2.3]|uniref:hypothetical protein n=1 Tax=Actimicrobium sp. CCI2.3 TaxID=3048616 RepID=UPI002AB38291|nr:hypothetical protein [Actimicrobium sp. CCI2.3]MDY7572687.1 hypothetical protein [Actimicrobium sp. CCI2.3]MEB0022207.1 hypothetical protein [Actimicrobium sp. CCI2.3]
MTNKLKLIVGLCVAASTITIASAREIQCKIADAFDSPEGAILFDYDDNRKVLTIVKTVGQSAVFIDNQYSWIREAVGKPANDISKDPNLIWARHQGQHNWEFKLDRQNGTIQINQTRMQMYWKGRCKLVDRSNKL